MIKSDQVAVISESDCHQIILRRWHLESLELAHLLVDTILDKKGSHITLLDLREQTVFADYFLICTAENDRQLRALAQSVVEDAKQNGKVMANGREGMPETGWVLVDFGDLIVHLFSPSTRAYYNLEELWAEAHVVLHMQ
ncbi:MAG: ribosome silencing factor [Anaerolineales bacterium]|nr:ribosome silencing factor [Anaerolineales bacterium]MCA9932271.1 ribosome silencing factor [Anaerolineales bacterium]